MKIRLIEEFDPVQETTRYEVQRLAWYPPMWLYVYGNRNLVAAREVFERVKKEKTFGKTIRVLSTAIIRRRP